MFSLITEETESAFIKFLNLLEFNYQFYPKYMTIDFAKAEENAILEVYKNNNIKIIFCFFHLIKNWRKKLNNLGLRNKNYIKTSKTLIFNLKLLAFIKISSIDEFYNDIKNSDLFKNDKYKAFFNYLDKYWMKKNLYKKWNYYDFCSLNDNNKDNDEYDRVIFLTNNACETLHSYIKQMISNNNKVNIYVFNNILCNLISKNNFDSDNKRKKNNINKKYDLN